MEVAFVRNKLEARDKVIVSEALIRQCLQLEDKFKEEIAQPLRDDAGPGNQAMLLHGELVPSTTRTPADCVLSARVSVA